MWNSKIFLIKQVSTNTCDVKDQVKWQTANAQGGYFFAFFPHCVLLLRVRQSFVYHWPNLTRNYSQKNNIWCNHISMDYGSWLWNSLKCHSWFDNFATMGVNSLKLRLLSKTKQTCYRYRYTYLQGTQIIDCQSWYKFPMSSGFLIVF